MLHLSHLSLVASQPLNHLAVDKYGFKKIIPVFGLKTNLSHSPFILSYTIRIRKHKSTARKVKVFTTRVSSGYVYVYGWSPVAILADYVFSF
jgi:hypothetical protein